MNKIKLTLTSIIITFIFIFVSFLTYNLAEPKSYDFMTKHFVTKKLPFDKVKQTYGSDDIVLVIVDKDSASRYRWPWKRELYCDIFNYFLNYANEKVVVYDALITTLD